MRGRQSVALNGEKQGSNGEKRGSNGNRVRSYLCGVRPKRDAFCRLHARGAAPRDDAFWHARANSKSVVERRTEDGDDKMREVGSAFVELKVSHDTVVGEIFCHARFGNAKMFRQARLNGIGAAATSATAQKAANGDAQCLEWFNVIVG